MTRLRARPRRTADGVSVAYVATGYPFPSHTFIQNEVAALRRRGADVHTFTNRRAQPEHILSEADRREFETTVALLPVQPLRWLRALLALLLTNLAGLGRAARTAWGSRSGGARGAVWQAFYLAEAVVLWAECRRRGVHHIHAHFANVSSDIAMLAAAIGGPGWTWSFTMHGPTEFYDVRFFRLDAKVRAATFVACISHFARSQLMTLAPVGDWDKLHIVRCGVNLAALSPSTPPAEQDRRLRIVCVGRLVPEKGQPLLVDAVAGLRAQSVDASLVLVGEGPTRPVLEAAVARLGLEDAVELTGALGHPEALARMRDADVLCLASFAEGIPVTLMEAMAQGMPVVSTRIMGIPELIEDGVSGLLVPPGDGEALQAALMRLAVEPDLRGRLGERAREHVVETFDIAREAERLHALFDRYAGR